MKRLHVHVSVADLDEAIRYYGALFGAEPTRREADYAKWQLDDPAVHFAVSTFEDGTGLNHLGIEVASADELAAVRTRITAAGEPVADEAAAACCYAQSDKTWSRDPAGIAWEAFHTTGALTERGTDKPPMAPQDASAGCCG